MAIGVFSLYAGGGRDYLLILTDDADYIRGQFGNGGVPYFAVYPLPLRIIWTINILGGLIAALLLLARSRCAVAVAVVAATAQVVLLAVTFAFRDRSAALGSATAWFDIGVGLVTALFALYCWTMRRRGILR